MATTAPSKFQIGALVVMGNPAANPQSPVCTYWGPNTDGTGYYTYLDKNGKVQGFSALDAAMSAYVVPSVVTPTPVVPATPTVTTS